MAKRPTQKTITSGFSSASMLNYNVNEMQTAFDNTLSLDGSAPNAMSADFDMNSNDILNAGDITAVNVTVTGTLSGAAVVGLTATNNLSDVASATTSATNLGLGTGDSPQFTAVNVGGTAIWTSGTGTPEAAVTAPIGSLFTRTDGGTSTTLYIKESGAGNTGWVAK